MCVWNRLQSQNLELRTWVTETISFDTIWPHLTPCGVKFSPACEEEGDDQGQVASSDVSRLPVVFLRFRTWGKMAWKRTSASILVFKNDGMINPLRVHVFLKVPVGFFNQISRKQSWLFEVFLTHPLPPTRNCLCFRRKNRYNTTQQDFSKLVTWGTFGSHLEALGVWRYKQAKVQVDHQAAETDVQPKERCFFWLEIYIT